jgi:hypothetical protein
VVQPAMVVETRGEAREAGRRDCVARLAMDRRSQRVVDGSRGRASARVHPPRPPLRFAELQDRDSGWGRACGRVAARTAPDQTGTRRLWKTARRIRAEWLTSSPLARVVDSDKFRRVNST